MQSLRLHRVPAPQAKGEARYPSTPTTPPLTYPLSQCNRVWPCNHCQKRKVADKCRFSSSQPAPDKSAGQDTGRKRQLSHDDLSDNDTNPWDDGESGFEALGYTPAHLFSGLATSEVRLLMPLRLPV